MPDLISEKRSNRGWWSVWFLLVICIVVACLGAGYYYYYHIYLQPETEEVRADEPCLTKECLKASIEITSSLDLNEHPCMDFYQFTCGKFIAEAREKNNPSPYFVQQIRTMNKLVAIISEPVRGNENRFLLLQKQFYQACMDVKAIDEEQNESFRSLIKELGGWPILQGQNWVEKRLTLRKLLLKCKNLGLPFQWLFEVKYNDEWEKIQITPPKIIKQYHESYRRSAYLNVMVETAFHLGGSRILARNEMEKILSFEEEFEEMISMNDDSYKSNMSMEELHNAFPKFSWMNFLNNLTEDANFTVTEDDTVVASQKYLQDLNLLLAYIPKRVQVNYIIWKIIQEFGYYLSTPLRETFGNFTNFMVSNEDQTHTRFVYCIKEARTRFPHVAELEFFNLYTEDRLHNVKEIIGNIKDQFISRLKSTEWIDSETKEKAINKVKSIVEVLGYDQLDSDEKSLEKYLNIGDLEFTSGNIIDMIREKNLNDFKQQFLADKTYPINELTLNPIFKKFEVYAGYNKDFNAIVISPGTMQDSLFSLNRPNYLNYGALGSIIGHEIAHSLDRSSDVYDSKEEVGNTTANFNETLEIDDVDFSNTTELRHNENLEALEERLKCIIEEYELLGDGVDGEQTLEENFADLIGIDAAYEAYIKWGEENEEENLPSLQFTPAQMFWIQFGTVNCFKKIGNTQWKMDEDRHASVRYRVMNALRNSENFARDFDCPVGTPMNSRNKCHVF